MAKIFNINIAPTKLYIKPFFLIIPVVVGKSLILTNGVKLIPPEKTTLKKLSLIRVTLKQIQSRFYGVTF